MDDCILKQDESFYFYFISFICLLLLFKGFESTSSAVSIIGGSAEIRNCEFLNFYIRKYEKDGAALYVGIANESTYLFEDCVFKNCRGEYGGSKGRGGGICAGNFGDGHFGILKLIRTSFISCRSREGGGVSALGSFFFFLRFILTL
jgi:hypothetical protein